MALGSIFGGFWAHVGGKLGPSWHQKPKNECTKKMLKKRLKKVPENEPS